MGDSVIGGQRGRQVGRTLEVEQSLDLGGGGACEGAAAAVELAEGRHGFAERFSQPKDLPVDGAVAEIVNC